MFRQSVFFLLALLDGFLLFGDLHFSCPDMLNQICRRFLATTFVVACLALQIIQVILKHF